MTMIYRNSTAEGDTVLDPYRPVSYRLYGSDISSKSATQSYIQTLNALWFMRTVGAREVEPVL